MSVPEAEIEKRKNRLRRECKAIRSAISPAERREQSGRIFRELISLKEFQNSPALFCYAAMEGEIDTRELITYALAKGMPVAVPRCSDKDYTISFYRIFSFAGLRPGRFGIPEPEPLPENRAEAHSGGFCVVPGLCFDRTGNRIGYGKGYYDRFLNNFPGFAAGICASALLLEEPVPAGAHDCRVSAVVTEKEILKFSPLTGLL